MTEISPTDFARVVCSDYYFTNNLDIRDEKTCIQYHIAWDNFDEAIERPAIMSDLTDENIVKMMRMLMKRGLAARTINERRGRIHTFWTFMAKRGFWAKFPTTGCLPVIQRIPKALSHAQLLSLWNACLAQPGYIGKVPAGIYWSRLMALAWNTSERKSALLAFKWKWIDFDSGTIHVEAEVRKGKRKEMLYYLWPDVIELLSHIPRDEEREEILPWTLCESSFYVQLANIMRRAGLPHERRMKMQCIRVSHATWLEVGGGNATERLGHEFRATTRKCYLDTRILKPSGPALYRPWGVPVDAPDVRAPALIESNPLSHLELPVDHGQHHV